MNYEIAKKNRLQGRFDFSPRDWQFELDGVEDAPPVPFRDGRPRRSQVVWKREDEDRQQATFDDVAG